eukprot:gene4621-6500_t
MSDSQIVTLQFGSTSNFTAAHLWNIRSELLQDNELLPKELQYSDLYFHNNNHPRTIIVDFSDELTDAFRKFNSPDVVTPDISSVLWSGKIFSPPQLLVDHQKSYLSRGSIDIKSWLDFSQLSLHQRSLTPLPTWSNPLNFESFFNGNSSYADALSKEFVAVISDKVRYFAEACDHMALLDIYSDINNGYGGLTCSVLEEIRDDYGNIPVCVWGLDSNPVEAKTLSGLPTIHSNMNHLNSPMLYSQICELSTLFIPVNIDHISTPVSLRNRHCNEKYSKTAIVASSIDIATCFLLKNGVTDSVRFSNNCYQWCNSITSAGRFPIGCLQSCIPTVSNNIASKDLLTFIHHFDSMSDRSNNNNKLNQQKSFASNTEKIKDSISFLKNLSFSKQNNEINQVFQSSLNFRGIDFSDEITSTIRNCLNFPSNCCYYSTPLVIPPNSFKDYSIYYDDGQDIEEANSLSDESSFSKPWLPHYLNGVAGISCESIINEHLIDISNIWKDRLFSSQVQLSKIGLSDEMCEEIQENLLVLANRYNTSRDL